MPDLYFLEEWRREAEAAMRSFAEASLTARELEQIALSDGFRTLRDWEAARDHGKRALDLFLTDRVFLELWEKLVAIDGDFPWLFSPINAGVPVRFLQVITHWYQTPKMTAQTRAAHLQRMRKLCDDLLVLMKQVVPSHELDDGLNYFDVENEGQARYILNRLGVDGPGIDKSFVAPGKLAGRQLEGLGITPLWALEHLMSKLSVELPRKELLPTKVNSRSSKRTYFIRAVKEILEDATTGKSEKFGIGPTLQAEIVARLAECDCSDDDVRKVSLSP